MVRFEGMKTGAPPSIRKERLPAETGSFPGQARPPRAALGWDGGSLSFGLFFRVQVPWLELQWGRRGRV